MINISHKIPLDPTKEQERYFRRAAGTARFAWNWALAQWQEQYKAGEKPNHFKIHKHLTSIKKDEFPWMYEVSKTVPQYAIYDGLKDAFQRFFKKLGRYPRFKKKGQRDSFRIDNGGGIPVKDNKLRIPKLGWVKMLELPRFEGRIVKAVVSRTADRWYVSLTFEVDQETLNWAKAKPGSTVGVDLGVKTLATLSTGEKIYGPNSLRSNLEKLKHLSKAHSRKKKGSRNREKSRRKLARLHARIAHIRSYFLHNLTTYLVENYETIVIENLNVRGMVRNRKLSRAISDCGFGEFKRQLAYKSQWRGNQLVLADRWFPSSKTCSSCNEVYHDLALSQRSWTCDACGACHDRDLNAAVNLENLALNSRVTACGEGVSPGSPSALGRPSVKQETSEIMK